MKKEYVILFKQLLMNYVNDMPPCKVLDNYYRYNNDEYEEGFEELQDFIGNVLKPEYEWVTSIGLIESIESNINEAISNCNVNFNAEIQGLYENLIIEYGDLFNDWIDEQIKHKRLNPTTFFDNAKYAKKLLKEFIKLHTI